MLILPTLVMLLLLSPNPVPHEPACYTTDDIAAVFKYKGNERILIWSNIFKDNFDRPSPYKWAEFYDDKTAMFFFFPITADGCLHPEGVRIVTEYDYSYVTESVYA